MSSIELKNIPILEERLKTAALTWLQQSSTSSIEEQSSVSLQPTEVTETLFKELQILQPFGQENPEPRLSIRNAKIISFKPMSDGQHARFQVLGASNKIKFIIWNRASEFESAIARAPSINLLGFLEENYYNNSATIQFVVTAFRI